jgi:hypothetical protein
MKLKPATFPALCLTVLLSSFALHLHAQRISVDLGAGYGFGLTSTYYTVGKMENDAESGVLTRDIRSLKFNYNEGFTGHLKVNYALPSSLFLVAGARYQQGSRQYDSFASNTIFDPAPYVSTKEFTFRQLDAQIGLGIQKKLSDRWSMYFSHGFTFFVYGEAMENELFEQDNGGQISVVRTTTTHRPAFTFGAYGDIGFNYRLSDHISLFFNTTIQSKNWSTKHSTVTESNQDGVDQLPESTTSQLETEYASTIESSLNGSGNPNEATVELKEWMPNSGCEAVIGVRFGFGSGPVEKEKPLNLSRLYLQGTVGYGMPMSERTLTSSSTVIDPMNSDYTTSSESRLFSYGRGISGQLLLGLHTGKAISWEIGAVFNTSSYTTKDHLENSFFGANSVITDNEFDYAAWMLRNTYGLRMESDFEKVNAFVRMGVSLGFAGLTETQTTATQYNTQIIFLSDTQVEYKYSGGLSLGAYIGLGTSVRLNNRLDFVAEAVTYIQNWSPKRREMVSFTAGGQDFMANLSYYDTHIEYLSEVDDNGEVNADAPNEQLRISQPFSSFMLTVGLRWHLVKVKTGTRIPLDTPVGM